MKRNHKTVLSIMIFLTYQILPSQSIHPEVTSVLNSLLIDVERKTKDQELSLLLDHIDQAPRVLANLIDQFTGQLAAKSSSIKPKRDNEMLFCRLSPSGKRILTVSKIGLLSYQEIESGRITLSHCIGKKCTDAVIDGNDENILLALNSNGYKVHHINMKTREKTDITSRFVQNPQRPFRFYPTGDPNLVVVVNDPSCYYNITQGLIYHTQTHQQLHTKIDTLAKWKPDNDTIELTLSGHKTTWSTRNTATPTEHQLPPEIKNIKKMICTIPGAIGITEDGVIFCIKPNSIDIITKIDTDFSDIDIKKNTIVVSHPTTGVSLFKIYKVMDLLKAYQAQISEFNSDADSESDED